MRQRDDATTRSRALTRGVVGAAVAMALLASACGSSSDSDSSASTSTPDVEQQASGDVQTGSKVIYGLEAESGGFDPANDRWAVSGNMVAYAVFDPLAAYDADGNIQPYLAQSFESSPDFLTWTINLRPGVTFHDGSALDSAALVGSMSATKASPLAGPSFSNIDTITATGPLAVEVKMKAPWASFPVILTGQTGVVAAPAQVALPTDDPAKKSEPIGTGPFVLKSWTPDKNMVLTRNPNYWMKDEKGIQLPYLDELEFRPIVDNQQRIDALSTGDITEMQTADPIAAVELNALAARGEIQVKEDRGENEETFVMFNTEAEPFNERSARLAVAYATDDPTLLGILKVPADLQTDSAFGKDSPFYFDSAFPEFDPAKAQEYVAEYTATTGKPLEFTLGTTTVIENKQNIEALQAMYEAVGMKVTLNIMPQDQFVSDAVQGKYQANLWRQFGATDPDFDYQWWHESNARGSLTLNLARFVDAEISAALDAARATDDVEVRKQQYQIVQERWASEVPYVWLYTTRWLTGADNRLRNLGSVAIPDAEGVANIPSLPYQAGSSRMTMTWIEK